MPAWGARSHTAPGAATMVTQTPATALGGPAPLPRSRPGWSLRRAAMLDQTGRKNRQELVQKAKTMEGQDCPQRSRALGSASECGAVRIITSFEKQKVTAW
ncbi:homeobox protein GBX-1 [Platysternon megacephalum]|uniref:Homeobox protein GBX-1 n=1 Tax=Platysternon megacephalum TaxID=55544 RepID=A0A4D9DTW7_9SAUR|nr:homeobox protein GBX-1 [Platysternon megacephalum]